MYLFLLGFVCSVILISLFVVCFLYFTCERNQMLFVFLYVTYHNSLT